MRNLVISLIGLLTLFAVAVLVDLWRAQTAVPGVSTTRVALNGLESLEMSLTLSRGPYFVSQLITADVSLANYSQTAYELPNLLTQGPCGSALYPWLADDASPEYVLPNQTMHGCPVYSTFALKPGQTLTIRHFVPLTKSGKVTVTGMASFLATTVYQGGGLGIGRTTGPFEDLWPSIHMDVDGQVPPDRTFSLEKAGERVIVQAPTEIRDQVVYLINVECKNYAGSGRTLSGNYAWQPVQNGEINLMSCPGVNAEWTVSVSAPGYAIVSARYR